MFDASFAAWKNKEKSVGKLRSELRAKIQSSLIPTATVKQIKILSLGWHWMKETVILENRVVT